MCSSWRCLRREICLFRPLRKVRERNFWESKKVWEGTECVCEFSLNSVECERRGVGVVGVLYGVQSCVDQLGWVTRIVIWDRWFSIAWTVGLWFCVFVSILRFFGFCEKRETQNLSEKNETLAHVAYSNLRENLKQWKVKKLVRWFCSY